MEDLKVIFASNMISLRAKADMTQLELASKINYSDKSVSKWERAEALPDVAVVKSIADTFGVSVDYMLVTHDQWEPDIKSVLAQRRFDEKMVISVAMIGVWTLAILLFVIFWILGQNYWIIFVSALPVSLIALLVLNTLWNKGRHNKYIAAGIVFGIFAVIYFALRAYNPWQLVFVLVMAEIVTTLSFRIKKVPKAGSCN